MKKTILLLLVLATGVASAQVYDVNQTYRTKHHQFTLSSAEVGMNDVVLNFEVRSIVNKETWIKLATNSYIKDSTGIVYPVISSFDIYKNKTILKPYAIHRFSLTFHKPLPGVNRFDYVIPGSFTFKDIRIEGPDKQSKQQEDLQEDLLAHSDVDNAIPISNLSRDKTYVVIVANEEYGDKGISRCQYTKRDGTVFKEYCEKTLGIPSNNIHYRENATRNQMRQEVKWVSDIANVFGDNVDIIFYYSGHGMPDERSKEAYLMPTDGIPNDHESAYPLTDLYRQLGETKANRVVLFLDACFSGASRSGQMLTADSKGVGIRVNRTTPEGRLVVFSASQGDETAYPMKDQKHGLFTYYLLKKLQETNGNVSLGELANYIEGEVKQYSVISNGKLQSPSVIPSRSMSQSWRNARL